MVKKNTLIFNTDKRKNATNSFENLSKRINVRVVNNTKTILNIQAKPSFFFHRRYLIKILLLFMKLNQF